jgi:small GTP-binding protein
LHTYSVGKSSLLNEVTDTKSEAAAYEFTTLTCIPGNLVINDTKIQLLDLPGIIEGAAGGKGRGREVIAVARSADLILMVLDGAREYNNQHRDILERELETMGIRLNQNPPDIYYRVIIIFACWN